MNCKGSCCLRQNHYITCKKSTDQEDFTDQKAIRTNAENSAEDSFFHYLSSFFIQIESNR